MAPKIWPKRTETGVVLLLVGVLLILGCLGVAAVRAGRRAASLKAHLNGLEALAKADQPWWETITPARTHIAGAGDDLVAVQAELGPWLPFCQYLGWIPGVGGDIQSAPHLLDMAVAVTNGGALLTEGISPFVERTGQAGESTTPAQGLAFLTDAEPALSAARTQLAAGAEARERIDVARLSTRTADLVARMDRYLSLMQAGVDGALVISRAFGGAEPRNILLLAQNDDELRATGGFISGAVLLTFQDGIMVHRSVLDSYQVDDLSKPYPPPPWPIRDYMAADIWLFRDANWSPDFPTAARDAEGLYALGQGQTVAGVIAADQQALRLMVDVLGPLQIEGYADPVTGDNLVEYMRAAWAPDPQGENTGEWWQHRKDFMADVLGAVVNGLEQDPHSADRVRLAQALHRSLEERHLLVYLHDPVSAELLAERGWDGRLQAGTGDYLMVVDSNVGFNKVNPSVRQKITYAVDLTDSGHLQGEVTIAYHNDGNSGEGACRQEARYGLSYEDMMNRCYWDYVRVLVPSGSQLISATPAPLPEGSLARTFRGVQETPDTVTVEPGEGETTAFGAFFVIAGGESRELAFAYDLPPSVVQHNGTQSRYRLSMPKQAGTDAIPLEVRVRLPSAARAVASWPKPTSIDQDELIYELSLQTDQRVELQYE